MSRIGLDSLVVPATLVPWASASGALAMVYFPVTCTSSVWGHTHEDIDQLFSLLVPLVLRCHHFQTPEELLNFLAKELQPKFEAKREEFHREVVTGVRDWQLWLLGLNRSISQCWANRHGQEPPK